jgi:hypothetical protein
MGEATFSTTQPPPPTSQNIIKVNDKIIVKNRGKLYSYQIGVLIFSEFTLCYFIHTTDFGINSLHIQVPCHKDNRAADTILQRVRN